jgi:hypothetical protein
MRVPSGAAHCSAPQVQVRLFRTPISTLRGFAGARSCIRSSITTRAALQEGQLRAGKVACFAVPVHCIVFPAGSLRACVCG